MNEPLFLCHLQTHFRKYSILSTIMKILYSFQLTNTCVGTTHRQIHQIPLELIAISHNDLSSIPKGIHIDMDCTVAIHQKNNPSSLNSTHVPAWKGKPRGNSRKRNHNLFQQYSNWTSQLRTEREIRIERGVGGIGGVGLGAIQWHYIVMDLRLERGCPLRNPHLSYRKFPLEQTRRCKFLRGFAHDSKLDSVPLLLGMTRLFDKNLVASHYVEQR